MKKSLLAMAVLAVAAGAAQAQSSVELYGVMDVHFGSKKAGVGAKSLTKLDDGGISPSRWGLRGTEDLGGGLKAKFVLEQGFNADTGTQAVAGTAFSRQAYVALAGGFGEVQLGNAYSAYDDVNGAVTPMFDSIFSVENNIFASTGYNSRPKNNIKYISPDFGGLVASFSFSLDEALATKKDVTSLSLAYTGGPLFVGFGYQTEGDAVGTDDRKYTRLNAAYDFGSFKLVGIYGRESLAAERTTDWSFGADVPMGAFTLSAGYGQSKDNVAAGSEKRTGFTVGGSYAMSKRTSIYGGVTSYNGKTLGVKTTDGRIVAVGIRHAF